MRPSDYANKRIPIGSLVLNATGSPSHIYRVCAWFDPSENQMFPVCLAYRDGQHVRISFIDVLPWRGETQN